MKILVDMNLSPNWCGILAKRQFKSALTTGALIVIDET